MPVHVVKIYTDGSSEPQSKTGGWAAILLIGDKKILIKGIVARATHNQMELQAVLSAVDYLKANKVPYQNIEVYSDSQYVVNLCHRKEKLQTRNFMTKAGLPIRNSDLVKKLITMIEHEPMTFIKVKAHQKASEGVNYNREVDMLVRKMVRDNQRRSRL